MYSRICNVNIKKIAGKMFLYSISTIVHLVFFFYRVLLFHSMLLIKYKFNTVRKSMFNE